MINYQTEKRISEGVATGISVKRFYEILAEKRAERAFIDKKPLKNYGCVNEFLSRNGAKKTHSNKSPSQFNFRGSAGSKAETPLHHERRQR